ncbi:MAG: dTDP-glucose 4,6-dehydratase [Gemmatimonadetes bacterium]|nr:dTDP-glucose 4,6-dehydratase [Gemmatimonadota bacterium]
MKLLVTGGAGFMGSDFVRLALEGGSHEVVVLDALTYAGNLRNLQAVDSDARFHFVHGDICDQEVAGGAMAGCDAVVHFAAETHVDRSIRGDREFVRTNVEGTRVLLSAALEAGIERFLFVSTDEVYGQLPWRDPGTESTPAALARFRAGNEDFPTFFTEESPFRPRSPYAATKAAADHLALAYHHTHGLPVVVTRASNNYGPYQFPEKLIPLMIRQAIEGGELPVYGDGRNVRDWLFVRDHSRGVLGALERGEPGEAYNLGGLSERTNLEVVRGIVRELGVGEGRIRFIPDRPGHDARYALDPGKAERVLGWAPTTHFEEGLPATVRWYKKNEAWWKRAGQADARR